MAATPAAPTAVGPGHAVPASPPAPPTGRGRRLPLPALTPAGRTVLGGSLALHAIGWGLGYAEAMRLAAAGIVALAVALAWTRPRPDLEIRRTIAPQRVIRGERADARLRVTNRSRRGLPRFTAVDRVGDREVGVALPRIDAGDTSAVRYRLPTARRGILAVGPLRVIRRDPLGLMEVARTFGATDTLWVYPKVYPVTPLAAGRRRDLEGPTSDGAAGSITFHALREYVTGDDLRLIHWRSTARTGKLMIRQQADPSQPETTVVLDTLRQSYTHDDAFEAAVEAAASLVTASVAHRFPVRLFTGTGLTATGWSSRGKASSLLDQLTPLQRSDEGSLADVAARLAARPGGHSLVVITGAPHRDDLLAVETLRTRYDVTAVVRFRADVQPGVSWDHAVIDLVAPDTPSFAALWNERVA